MGEFFAGLAIIFALLLFGRRGGGRGPGELPPGVGTPGGTVPNNPSYGGPPALPSGPSGSGCRCGSATSYTPPPATQVLYGNIPPAQPNPSAPAASPSAAPASYSSYTVGGGFDGVGNQITIVNGPNGPYAVAG
jgi:hypothetical protein